MAFEQISNNAISSLSSGITAVATSLQVADATNFPSAGNFRIIVENEVMLVTGVSGSTFTVVRGQEGTGAATHDADVAVVHGITTEGIKRLINDYIPLFTDRVGPYNSLTDGSTTLTASSFTWLNQGTSTCTDLTEGGLSFVGQSGTGPNIRGKYKSVTAPWTVTTAIVGTPNWDGGAGVLGHFGLIAYDSVSGRISCHARQTDGTIRVLNYTNATTYNSDVVTPRQWGNSGVQWFQLEDNSTNLYYRLSLDGIHWNTIYVVSRTAFLTNGPDNVGFYMNSNDTVDAPAMSVVHWSEE